ncbi:MFS transporter [Salix suchowensis]|nr:MFS transporter [Salix suchowensis]
MDLVEREPYRRYQPTRSFSSSPCVTTSMSFQESDHKALTKRILWKLDCRILPPLALLWLANFVDRSNIGNTRLSPIYLSTKVTLTFVFRIAGLERDLELHGNQFNTMLAELRKSTELGNYSIHGDRVHLASNWVIQRVGANRWIPLLVCLWGVVTTLTGLVQNFGVWWHKDVPRSMRRRSVAGDGSLFKDVLELGLMWIEYRSFISAPFTSDTNFSYGEDFGRPPRYCITRMEGVGGLSGWRWIFILEGIATVILSIVSAVFLPANLESAKFLTEEERTFASKWELP